MSVQQELEAAERDLTRYRVAYEASQARAQQAEALERESLIYRLQHHARSRHLDAYQRGILDEATGVMRKLNAKLSALTGK